MPEADAEKSAEVPVGEYLRGVREAKGLELDDAARVTKIGKNYLAAIEAGQFEKLPNAAYIKGFLRLYAGYLALTGDDVVARYERGLPPPPDPRGEAPRVAAKKREHRTPGMEAVERAKLGGRNRWVVPTLLLAMVIVAAFFLTEGEQNPAPPPPAPPAPPSPPVQAPMTSALQQRISSARTAPAAPGTEPAPTAAPGRQSGIVLRLRFTRDSWLGITIDDTISQRYDLKAGDIIEWKGQRSFALDLGDGGAVEGDLNGKPLKAFGEPGKPAHVELKGEPQRP